MRVNLHVHDIEPGWLLITFQEEKPPPESRPFWLHRMLTDWLHDHPGQQVRRTLPVQDQGQLVALMAWLGEPAATPTRPRTMPPLRLAPALKRQISFEHLEAFCEAAYEIFFQRPPASPALAVINRTGVAIVFDRQSQTGHILPIDQLGGLEDPVKARLAAWRLKPDGNYFVIELRNGFQPLGREGE